MPLARRGILTVILIESNTARRDQIASALRAAGNSVLAVERMADVERWPTGDVVITEAASFTPLWMAVGATHVVVLADSPALGLAAFSKGAAAWVSRSCNPDVLLATLKRLGVGRQMGANAQDETIKIESDHLPEHTTRDSDCGALSRAPAPWYREKAPSLR
jgi:hypothetical protein